MKNLFLKTKHWQLFLILCTLPCIIFIICLYFELKIIISFKTADSYLLEMLQISKYIIPLEIFCFILYGSYNYILLTSLNKVKPIELRNKLTFSKFCIFFCVLHFCFFFCFIYFTIDDIIKNQMQPNCLVYIVFFIIFGCHFLSIFALFYLIYQLSYSLRCVELQRKPKFEEYLPEFVLFWVFPIGLWFLQPRINKIFQNE